MIPRSNLGSIQPSLSRPSLTAMRSGSVGPPLRPEMYSGRSDVSCSHIVCVGSVATPNTPEMSLSWTIGTRSMSAHRARLRRAARITEQDWNASSPSFVLDEVCQLTERPPSDHTVEFLASPSAVTNTIQPLEYNDRVRIGHRESQQLRTEFVVHVSRPPRFLSALDIHPICPSMTLVAST